MLYAAEMQQAAIIAVAVAVASMLCLLLAFPFKTTLSLPKDRARGASARHHNTVLWSLLVAADALMTRRLYKSYARTTQSVKKRSDAIL